MSKIYEQLYLGSIKEMMSDEWLKAHHITHIVNCPYGTLPFFPNKYSYISLQLDDVPEQSLYHVLEPAFEYIKKAISNGGTVLVACHAGISRSASVVIYFLMKIKGMTFSQALEYVRSKRSIVNPNPGFRHQLISVSPEVTRHPVLLHDSELQHLKSSGERKYGIPSTSATPYPAK